MKPYFVSVTSALVTFVSRDMWESVVSLLNPSNETVVRGVKARLRKSANKSLFTVKEPRTTLIH